MSRMKRCPDNPALALRCGDAPNKAIGCSEEPPPPPGPCLCDGDIYEQYLVLLSDGVECGCTDEYPAGSGYYRAADVAVSGPFFLARYADCTWASGTVGTCRINECWYGDPGWPPEVRPLPGAWELIAVMELGLPSRFLLLARSDDYPELLIQLMVCEESIPCPGPFGAVFANQFPSSCDHWAPYSGGAVTVFSIGDPIE